MDLEEFIDVLLLDLSKASKCSNKFDFGSMNSWEIASSVDENHRLLSFYFEQIFKLI